MLPSSLPSEPLPWRTNTRPKLPPGVLLDIDQGPLWDILTEFLRLEDVCRLDSALCNKSRRHDFLQLVSTEVLRFGAPYDRTSPSFVRMTTIGEMHWIMRRGMHLVSLGVPPSSADLSSVDEEGIHNAVTSLANQGSINKLECLSLRRCCFMTDNSVVSVLTKCLNSLKTLDLRGSALADDDVEGWGITESTSEYIKQCTNLSTFFSSGNDRMIEIAQSCRNIRDLNLSSFADKLTDDTVMKVVVHLPTLELLCLSGCKSITDDSIKMVATCCPSLRRIFCSDLNLITDASVEALHNGCRELSAVIFTECFLLTDTSIETLSRRESSLKYLISAYNQNITSNAMISLIKKCPKLHTIGVAGCNNVSDEVVMAISEHCSKIVKLSIYDCDISAFALCALLSRRSKLLNVEIDEDQIRGDDLNTLKTLFPDVHWSIIT